MSAPLPARIPVALAARGALAALAPASRVALLTRGDGAGRLDVSASTREILRSVRAGGDTVLRALALEHDGVTLGALEVPRAALDQALAALPAPLRAAMERSRGQIARVHAVFRPRAESVSPSPGVVVTRRPDPFARVGVYAPGGRAAYPSSVLMGVVPARVAGVGEVIVCSPPGHDGRPSAVVLAAAALAWADRVFALGGAGAIAAMAYGTVSVPRVDRIVGPGNAWVMEAKRQVAGEAGIDAPAGPSELLVIADASADPSAVARELVAQAEHDPDAAVLALLIDPDLDETREEPAEGSRAWMLERALADAVAATPRRAIVTRALAARGAVLAVRTREEAAAFATQHAPEHLQIVTREPEALAASIRTAGTVFLGAASSVAFGDYMTGANHVLPTGGLARAWSGLSTLDFVRWTTLQSVTPAAAAGLAADTGVFADAEGLPAHAAAARAWSGAAPAAPGWVDLSDNTDRFGEADAALEVLRRSDAETVTRYPTLLGEPLIAALSGHFGMPAECLVTGCGSDDVLDLAFRTLAAPGARVAFPDPTFSMVPAFIAHAGLTPAPVPCALDGRPDIDALIAADTGIVYLCSPNNPTGGAVSGDALERLLERSNAFVILDEAYAEYAGDTAFDRLRRHPHLLVTRTFSKAYGLAGLRVGFGCGPAGIVAAMTRRRGPYRVTTAGEQAAVAAFAARDAVRSRVVEARAARRALCDGLVALGHGPLPSDANFLLLPVTDAEAAQAHFAAAGIGVRPFEALTRFGDAVRITVGPAAAMARVLAAAATLAPRRPA